MANYKAELPSGELVTIDVPEGQDPKVYIPHAVQMIERSSGSSSFSPSSNILDAGKSILEGAGNVAKTIGRGAADIGQRVGEGLLKAPGQFMDWTGSVLENAVEPPAAKDAMNFSPASIGNKFLDVGQGAGHGLSFGAYEPSPATSRDQEARRQLGELLAGGAAFSKVSQLLAPFIGSSLLRNPIISGAIGAAHGGAEGAGAGIGTGMIGEGVAAGGKALTRSLLAPGKQVLDTEDANAAIRISNAQKQQAALDDLQVRKVSNKEAYEQYVQQLDLAAEQAVGKNAAAHDAYMKARNEAQLKLDQAKHDLDPAQQEMDSLAAKIQPNTPSKVLYDPINKAIAEGTAPDIAITNTQAAFDQIGSNLAKSTGGLPKAAGATGKAEKIATDMVSEGAMPGVDPERSALLASMPENVQSFLGDTVKDMPTATLKRWIEAAGPIADKTGVGVNHVATLLEGKLGLGRVNRLLEVFGEQSDKSGLAYHFFNKLREDLKIAAKTDPMAQQLLDARASWRQEIASKQLAVKAAPVSKNGVYTYNPDKLKSIFNEKNPAIDAQFMRESFPPEVRTVVLDTLEQVFHVRNAIREAGAGARAVGKEKIPIKDTQKFAKQNTTKPDLLNENVDAPALDPEFEQQYAAPKAGVLAHPLVIAAGVAEALNLAFGADIRYSLLAGGVVAIKALAPPTIFKMALAASRNPVGRAFLRNLFRNEPPNTFNVDSLGALVNFLGVEAGRLAAQTGKFGMMAGAAQQQPQPGMPGAPQ